MNAKTNGSKLFSVSQRRCSKALSNQPLICPAVAIRTEYRERLTFPRRESSRISSVRTNHHASFMVEALPALTSTPFLSVSRTNSQSAPSSKIRLKKSSS